MRRGITSKALLAAAGTTLMVIMVGCGGAQAPTQSTGGSSSQPASTPTSAPASTATPQGSQFLSNQCEIGAENTNANILFTGGMALQLCNDAANGPGLPGDFGAPNDSGFYEYTWQEWSTPVTEATVCSGTTLGNTSYVVMDTGGQLVGESLCQGIPNG